MHDHASKMELGDKETERNCSYMLSSKRDMLSERIVSLYAYGTYHTRMVIPYAYGIQNCTIRVRYVPYAYGMYHTRMVCTIRVWYKIRVWYRTKTPFCKREHCACILRIIKIVT